MCTTPGSDRRQNQPGRRREESDLFKILHRVVEQSPSSIIVTDRDGTIIYVNPSFVQSTGYAKEEAVGKNTGLFKSDKNPTETITKLWETILSGNEWRGELSSKKKDGSDFWEHSVISSLKNDDGDITHFIAINTDITEYKNMMEALTVSKRKYRKLSITDSLTDLYNNRHFYERVETESNKESPLSVILLDIDNFKQINDTYGHVEGDRVLQQISQIIKCEVGEKHVPCRYGGEEFAIILPETTVNEAVIVAEKIRMTVSEKTVQTESGDKINLTVSLGVVQRKSYDDVESFMRRVDKLLYRSKSEGKNRTSSEK